MQENDLIRLITEEVMKELQKQSSNPGQIPVGLSNRHIHLSQEDLETLFGPGYQLTKLKDLSQPGQFAARETVKLISSKGIIDKVRILGPVRKTTQVELSISDGFQLGIKTPVRPSGQVAETPGCFVAGPKGTVELKEGVICAKRHIHMSIADAQRFGVNDQDMVQVKSQGQRSLIFDEVLVRVHPDFRLEIHLDLEEGNAAGLKNGDTVELIKEG